MAGEKDLGKLLKGMKPILHPGDYVFCITDNPAIINLNEVILLFKEQEGNTIIIEKELADSFHLKYSFVASWITLTIHSSLEAVGLTAAFSTVLAEEGISCNVVSAFYHDHIFMDKKDSDRAMEILNKLSGSKTQEANE